MTDQAESSDSPKWLKYIEEMIEEEEDDIDSEAIYYKIVRYMLLLKEDPDKAVSEAIQRFYDHYEDFGGREPPEYDAGDYLNSIADIVFELVAKIPFKDPKQDMLSNSLIGIAKNAADSFDEKVCEARDYTSYIFLAGEALAQDAKISSPERRYDLDAENWKHWASKLKEVSDTVDENVRWDLKQKTRKAYEKMVELYPGAFSSDENTGE